MPCKTLKVTPSCIPRRPCPLTARQGWDPGVCSPPFPRPLFPCSSFSSLFPAADCCPSVPPGQLFAYDFRLLLPAVCPSGVPM
jgi:hypothetical protein